MEDRQAPGTRGGGVILWSAAIHRRFPTFQLVKWQYHLKSSSLLVTDWHQYTCTLTRANLSSDKFAISPTFPSNLPLSSEPSPAAGVLSQTHLPRLKMFRAEHFPLYIAPYPSPFAKMHCISPRRTDTPSTMLPVLPVYRVHTKNECERAVPECSLLNDRQCRCQRSQGFL